MIDNDAEAAVKVLLKAFEALGGGGTILPHRLSPQQKAGLIIVARAIIHQRRGDLHASMLGHAMIGLLGHSEWPDQPINKSSTELLYRSGN